MPGTLLIVAAPFILPGMKAQSARGWVDYGRIAEAIVAPTFPNRDFPVTEFGANPQADATAAIQKAIEACHVAGGGRVVILAGTWRTGALRLKSNVNLHVSKGATLLFSFDLSQYPIVFTRWEGVECMNFSPFIYAFEQENIAVTGEGTLDGGATLETWWGWNRKSGRQPPLQRAARDKLI